MILVIYVWLERVYICLVLGVKSHVFFRIILFLASIGLFWNTLLHNRSFFLSGCVEPNTRIFLFREVCVCALIDCMKIISLAIFRTLHAPGIWDFTIMADHEIPLLVCASYDVSSFGYFQKSK